MVGMVLLELGRRTRNDRDTTLVEIYFLTCFMIGRYRHPHSFEYFLGPTNSTIRVVSSAISLQAYTSHASQSWTRRQVFSHYQHPPQTQLQPSSSSIHLTTQDRYNTRLIIFLLLSHIDSPPMHIDSLAFLWYLVLFRRQVYLGYWTLKDMDWGSVEGDKGRCHSLCRLRLGLEGIWEGQGCKVVK